MKILGIDIGGTGIKGSIVDMTKGKLVEERYRIPTPKPSTPKAVANTVFKMVKHFKWKGSVGCGFPAAIQQGIARTAANVDDKWINTPVDDLFSKTTGCPVKVVNDADAAGLAEVAFGAGKGKKGVVLLLTVGTGIGSALIYNGELVPNTELGHLRFHGGIAEHYTSDSIRKKEDLSWKEWGKRFDEYLDHIYRLFYPDLIIVGGGVSKRFKKFDKYLTVNTEVIPAQLLNNAGIIGAAMAAKKLKK